ncbi:hypothetical protein ILYODFUR_013783 [Ilyodon furcidens]|uniref:Uncharacterized protein n=1 Tax=Ilyodon furcidens TaxID=33524 RepID=A0ABV0V3L9_9TELE
MKTRRMISRLVLRSWGPHPGPRPGVGARGQAPGGWVTARTSEARPSLSGPTTVGGTMRAWCYEDWAIDEGGILNNLILKCLDWLWGHGMSHSGEMSPSLCGRSRDTG